MAAGCCANAGKVDRATRNTVIAIRLPTKRPSPRPGKAWSVSRPPCLCAIIGRLQEISIERRSKFQMAGATTAAEPAAVHHRPPIFSTGFLSNRRARYIARGFYSDQSKRRQSRRNPIVAVLNQRGQPGHSNPHAALGGLSGAKGVAPRRLGSGARRLRRFSAQPAGNIANMCIGVDHFG